MIGVGERERLAQAIEKQIRRSLSSQVRHAFLQVPRHLFVQQYYKQRGNSLNWDLVEATLETVYRDEALATQIDARGMPGSSTSQPSVMAMQLEALALEHGQRVLEIGAGTGYNAALLGAIVGDAGQVISIDIDEGLVEQAKQHLANAKVHNVLALPGDGFAGEATYAPYDRLLTTCSIRSIPHPWFDQLNIGGRLVGNLLTHLASLFICVEKTDIDKLEGGLLDISAAYMEMHTRDIVPLRRKSNWGQYDSQSPTIMRVPDVKTQLQNPALRLLLQCLLPEMRKRYRSKDGQEQLYLMAQDTAVLIENDSLLIFGNPEVGQIIQQSLALYHQLGQPRITEYHVTLYERMMVIGADNQCFYLPLV